MKNKLGVLYFSLHLHLKKKFGFKLIAKKDFYALLGRHFLIPKNLRICVLEEMKGMNLIEMIDKQNLRVSGTVINVDNAAKEFYQKMGFF